MKKLLSIILSVAMLVTMLAGVTAFADGETPEVTADKILTECGLTIKFADYTTYSGFKKTETDGNVYMRTGWYEGDNAHLKVSRTISVEKDGYYDIETVMGYTSNAQDYSKIVLTLTKDGDTTYTWQLANLNPGTDVNENYPSNGTNFPANKYNSKKVKLTAGNYTLCYEISKCGAAAKFMMDYIKFTPSYKAVDIALTGKTTIEFEDYVKPENENRVRTHSTDSNIKYIGYHWTFIPYPVVDIVVNVKEAGKYYVDMIMGYSSYVGSYGRTDVILYNSDNKEIKRVNNIEGANDGIELGGYASGYTLAPRTFNTGILELSAGQYTIKVEAMSTLGITTSGSVPCILDNISFKGLGVGKDTVTISGSAPTIIEYEDYVDVDSGSYRKDSVASGGWFVSNGYSSGKNPSTNIRVNVEKAGLYWVEVIQGYSEKTGSYGLKYVTMANDALDEVGFAYSDNDAEDLDETWNVEYTNYHKIPAHDITAEQTPMKKFRRLIWLPKGGNTIKTVVNAAGGIYKYNLDSITFIPVDGISVNGEDVTVTANWKSNFTGKAYVALYNGEELVNVTDMDIADASEVKLTLKETDTFDKAKIFVWDVANDNTPLTKARVFTK